MALLFLLLYWLKKEVKTKDKEYFLRRYRNLLFDFWWLLVEAALFALMHVVPLKCIDLFEQLQRPLIQPKPIISLQTIAAEQASLSLALLTK